MKKLLLLLTSIFVFPLISYSAPILYSGDIPMYGHPGSELFISNMGVYLLFNTTLLPTLILFVGAVLLFVDKRTKIKFTEKSLIQSSLAGFTLLLCSIPSALFFWDYILKDYLLLGFVTVSFVFNAYVLLGVLSILYKEQAGWMSRFFLYVGSFASAVFFLSNIYVVPLTAIILNTGDFVALLVSVGASTIQFLFLFLWSAVLAFRRLTHRSIISWRLIIAIIVLALSTLIATASPLFVPLSGYRILHYHDDHTAVR
ncbi:MAG: hypothetical protein M0P64_01800 [Candidatus Pacebacteria bacterium]|nr:hypothetical protein [Candidatus Paceibacterota bacterium]